MCVIDERLILKKAVAAAEAEWDLAETLRHLRYGRAALIEKARVLLEARGDRMALDAFEWAIREAPPEEPASEAAALENLIGSAH